MVSLVEPCKLVKSTRIDGYAQVTIDGKTFLRHRVALEQKLGRPIRDGYQACHHCDVRNCIEPTHLYEATQSTNLGDMYSRGRHKRGRSLRTHCYRGHELTPDNIHHATNGRTCLICRKLAVKKANDNASNRRKALQTSME